MKTISAERANKYVVHRPNAAPDPINLLITVIQELQLSNAEMYSKLVEAVNKIPAAVETQAPQVDILAALKTLPAPQVNVTEQVRPNMVPAKIRQSNIKRDSIGKIISAETEVVEWKTIN